MADEDPKETLTTNAAAFDRSTVTAERRLATGRLLARLKANEAPREAPTARAYAARYVREQESLILRLLDAGVDPEEILADLTISFRSIPRSDLRYALAQLRDRHRHRKPTGTLSPQNPEQPSELQAASSMNQRSQGQRPDESDDDYRLRRELEGSDELRREFIGEDTEGT